MAAGSAKSESIRKVGSVKLDVFEFSVPMDDKSCKRFLANPSLFFKKLATQAYGANHGVVIDAEYLKHAMKRAKASKGRAYAMKGVRCHIPVGKRACRIIIVKTRW